MGNRLDQNSGAVRKRISEHTFSDEAGDEYEASSFGGFSDYMRRKKIKLQNLDQELRRSASSSGHPQLFKGVVAHVSGYTQPPLHVLHKDLVAHGAGFLQYLDGKTSATHIIASSLTPKKAIEFKDYRIVKPAWVVDSIAAGRMLPWSDYRVVDGGARQKLIKFDDGGRLSSQVSTPQRGYREQVQNSFYTSQFKSPASSAASASAKAGSPSSSFSALRNRAWKPTPSAFTPSKLQPSETIEDDYDDLDLGELSRSRLRTSLVGPVLLPQGDDSPEDFGIQCAQLEEQDEDVDQETAKEELEIVANQGNLSEDSDKLSSRPNERTSTRSPSKKPMTSEEHNAWLLSDPRLRKSSTANPSFLQQYYGQSRLHHLSSWKAELKSRMQRLANEKASNGALSNKSIKRRPGARRYIMHVDFDSFFCAVSLKKAPEYIDKPAVVAHSTGTGSEIASCNYPARQYGIKNGMWMKKALELYADIKVLPYDFPAYEEASRLFYEAILELGGLVQSVSIDEALVDITSLVLKATGSDGHGLSEGNIWREQEKANTLATELRARVKEKTGCNVSIGIGSNILLAKVALRRAKPAGQYQILPEEVLGFLGELQVEDLPGVAYSIRSKLEEVGIRFVKDIRETSKERLVAVLGPKTGEKLWEYARGIDRAEVGDQPVRKSVSAEVNWGIRFLNQPEAEEFVMNLCKELERRLLNEGVKGTHLTVKIMRRSLDAPLDPAKHLGHGKCDTFNKSAVFGVATHNAETIGKEAVSILRSYNFSPGDLRGLGVQLQKLIPIKAASAAAPEGSQKKLNFGGAFESGTINSISKKAATAFAQLPKGDDEISDYGSPDHHKSKKTIDDDEDEHHCQSQRRSGGGGGEVNSDPIAEDPVTPRKPKRHPRSVHPALALARANEADAKANTPLNMMGTQFIMPTNPDAAVLAELPHDIRSRLMAQQKPSRGGGGSGGGGRPSSREQPPTVWSDISGNPPSRDQSPAVEIPPDIDPEVFNALPDDMKAEVLASYASAAQQPQTPRRRDRNGLLLPNNNNRPQQQQQPTKRSPAKRGRGGGIRGMLSRTRERQRDASAGRVQTSFITAGRAAVAAAAAAANHGENGALVVVGELDPEFLSELPEEVRREVIADHRRQKLAAAAQRTAGGGGAAAAGALLGLDLHAAGRRNGRLTAAGRDTAVGQGQGQTKISFPKRPDKVSFAATALTSVTEIRDMLSAWHRETKDEGPHREDVEVLERYLMRVVGEERDLEKVRGVVRWLGWIIEDVDVDGDGDGDWNDDGSKGGAEGQQQRHQLIKGREGWREALQSVKGAVQRAMRERGMHPMVF